MSQLIKALSGESPWINVKYFAHLFAGNQIVGDPKLYDISGAGNDGTFGANLSNANAWTNAGYATTINPTGGATDSVIRMPSFNFDYNGGEKFIMWWLGKCTPEGASASLLGDGFSATFGTATAYYRNFSVWSGNDGYNTVMGSPIPTPPIQVR